MLEDVETEVKQLAAQAETIDDSSTIVVPALIAYALIRIHAGFEVAIRDAVKEKCQMEDVTINSYIGSVIDRSVRSIKIKELSGLLGKFGKEFKESFKQHQEESAEAFQFYSNLETNRQSVAHTVDFGGQATMHDVVSWFLEARTVIYKFRQVLGLTS